MTPRKKKEQSPAPSFVAPEIRVVIPAHTERYAAMEALSNAMAEVAKAVAVLARDGQPNVIVSGCVSTGATGNGFHFTSETRDAH